MSVYLETAHELGRQIARDAVWSGPRCSWMGAMPEDSPAGVTLKYVSFTPDLYGGTAGVGLALAQLAAATGDAELRRTALGALEHALGRVDEIPDSIRLGAYSGRLGVAVAAVHAGRALAAPELEERGFALTTGVDLRTEPLEHDLLGGRAGGIVALLVLHRLGGENTLVERAVQLGDDLVAAAERNDETLSWGSPSYPEQPSLTGVSHGAAGISLALLELHSATGEERFRAASAAGFAYERLLYEPAAQNWPDLRELASAGGPSSQAPSYPVMWCHGAPGIAISRLRAYELTGEESYRDEARVALATTARAVSAELGDGNYSLCHGLAGNAEVLAEGAPLDAESAQLVEGVAVAGIETYGPSGAWPEGVYDGTTDSLMLGRAGTAYFYLRLHDPRVPSVLLLRPTPRPQ